MSVQQIQEKIWDLRNQQANCTPEQRAAIQQIITRLYAILDRMN